MLDVERMLAKSSKDMAGGRQQQEAESGHPVIRTLYDHFEVIIHKNGVVKRVIYGVCCLCLHSVIHITIILLKNNKTFTKMETMNTRFVFFVFH